MKNEYFFLTKTFTQAWDHEHYLLKINKMTGEALEAISLLRYYDPKDFANVHPMERNVFILRTLQKLVFFADDEVITKFRGLGFRRKDLERMVPLAHITAQLDAIAEDPSFVFFKHLALQFAHAYASGKITSDFKDYFLRELQAFYKDDSLKYGPQIRNFFRQRKYNNGTPPIEKHPIKQMLHETIDHFNAIFGDENTTKLLLERIATGKIEGFFLKWITQCCSPAQSSDEYFAKFFELFRMLIPYAKPFSNEEEFLGSAKYYGKTYEWYKAKWVKNAIRGVSSDLGSYKLFKREEFAVK